MKRLIYLLAIALALSSCNKSDEAKINALIKNDLSETMHDFNSYEPISTELDSIFDAAYFDERVWTLSKQIVENLKELEIIGSEIEQFRFDMELARINGTRSKKEELIKKGDELLANMKLKIDENKQLRDSIHSINEKSGHVFYGYLCNHRFRCNNAMGNKILANAGYFINSDCTKIVYRIFDEEDEKLVAQIAASIKNEE